jgi:CubicO group peptidase (beta-lactamase class C family)
MRISALLLSVCLAVSPALAAPAEAPAATPAPAAAAPPSATRPPEPAPAAAAPEVLAADTPKTTVLGNPFVAPAGWKLRDQGPATILEAPEGDSWIALVDVPAKDADEAVEKAWAAYKPEKPWPLKQVIDRPDQDGWTKQRIYDYRTSPNERRGVGAFPRQAGDSGNWTVAIYDMSDPVGGKRGAQVALIFDRLLPKGYTRESFAGKQAHRLDEARLAELARFVEQGMATLKVPGVAVGIVEDGKLVMARGFGVRELGKPDPVDADTLFMVASNTKAMTTLLLARLVDSGKVKWDTPATELLPSFALGDAATTRQVRVKHLICACTGLPRQDLEWLLEFEDLTPAGALATLATMQPTTGFGEMYQYSNPMAAAAGYAAGHVLYPDLELGAAYDRAMQEQVFAPLGMTSTTFDFARALAGNHAFPHAPDADGRPSRAVMELNYSVIPVRPAGAAWSSVRDMLKYVQMELDEGALPGGKRLISREHLLARREKQVPIGNDAHYGMGLMVDHTWGVPVVHHGGDMIGFHSDMMWLPGARVGAVVLTNGDPGWTLRAQFRRKLLEVLYDGRPEAAAEVESLGKAFYDQLAVERKLITIPADPAASAQLAARYHHPALGGIAVSRQGDATHFDFGEWGGPMASRQNPDGTVSFVTLTPGSLGFEFVVGPAKNGKRRLVIRDAQHEYVFEEI